MANNAILTRGKKIGNVLKKELWTDSGWCRKTIEVTVTSTMQVGSVLEVDTNAALATEVVTATDGEASLVLIDERIYNYEAGDTPELVVLYQGPCEVALNGLAYGTITDAGKLVAEAALTALGIKVVDSVI